MSFVVITGAAVLALTGAWFLYPRKPKKSSPELAGNVSCKKCGSRIKVLNPTKLHYEFGVRCTACESRAIYKLADLAG
jgi:DNA-directed RNA polymerase subunit RPC12/RpoP